ncbi:SufD family Fe-S cluster assembly protein [bacterium]|nr:SufD family Fe-S cluster assembly protein [bacterium]
MQKQLKELALSAKDKPAPYGLDIDISGFDAKPQRHMYQEDLSKLGDEERKAIEGAGLNLTCEGRSGSYVLMDRSMIHCNIVQPGVEVMDIADAIKKSQNTAGYMWRLVSPDADKYTSNAYLNPPQGYFIHILPGTKALYPVQACLYMGHDRMVQYVHNVVVAEEGAELDIITGCTTGSSLHSGLHVGISEFYVKKGAKVTFTMIHNWSEEVMVRPRTAVLVEESGTFISNYVSMHKVKSVQMYPVAQMKGENSTARFSSILVAPSLSDLDIGAKVFLQAKGARAEIISRAISTGGSIMARGCLIGEVPEVKAHLECRGLLLSEDGLIHAIPELVGKKAGVDLSHEAAVGKIAQDEIEYLMARGISESEATSIIVRGFLNVEIEGLSASLRSEIDKAVEESEKDLF